MKEQSETAPDAAPIPLGLVSFGIGGLAGLVGGCFRLSLDAADRLRNSAFDWGHTHYFLGLLVILACAGATALSAWLVRRFAPHASGSGIPHVEAVMRDGAPPPTLALIPVKFFGGLLSIGSGMALGREGPSVQMGATIGNLIGRRLRMAERDCLALLAGGAGAGLATAFNAPIAGAVFVLEELARRFDTRIAIATFGASAGAIAVSRGLLGNDPDFHVPVFDYPGFATVPIHLALGALAGLLGVAYNRTLIGAVKLADRWAHIPVEARAAAIGAIVGVLGWITPSLVGGGDPLTQRALAGIDSLSLLTMVTLIRFGLGPLCYAARTPGGLFAPLLVIGAQGGLAFGLLCGSLMPVLSPDPRALAVVGMAAFFTAVVRAPLTGIILAIELTGSFTLLLPMLSACFAAMLVPTMMRSAPIYDLLRDAPTEETSA